MENLLWIIVLMYIFILPIILKLKFWQKAIWIIINYITFIICYTFYSFLLDSIPESDKIYNKIQLITPSAEFEQFYFNNSMVISFLNEGRYLILVKKTDSKIKSDSVEVIPQFVTHSLFVYMLKLSINETMKEREVIINRLQTLDTIIKLKELKTFDASNNQTYRSSPYDSSMRTYKDVVPKKSVLDSFRKDFNTVFYNTLKLNDSLTRSAVFPSNRKYFIASKTFLTQYEESYTNHRKLNALTKSENLDFVVSLDSNYTALIFKIDANVYKTNKDNYLRIENELINKSKYSSFIFNIIYPIHLLY